MAGLKSFHALRHTWASLAVMGGVPLLVVAKNLGHVDTRMVEKHYGHLALPSAPLSETTGPGAPTPQVHRRNRMRLGLAMGFPGARRSGHKW
jgi:hypothetical protein